MCLLAFFVSALLLSRRTFFCAGEWSPSSDKNPNTPIISPNDDHGDSSALPQPLQMAVTVTDGSKGQTEIFMRLYSSAMEQFDVEGYNWLMKAVTGKDHKERFMQALSRIDDTLPHCDEGQKGKPGHHSTTAPFPGGAIRSTFGFDLAKWITDLLMGAHSAGSSQAPGLSNMAIQSLMMVKGLVQAISGTIMDIVPPLIPPPVWINRPLPCLPMVTGANCLGSVLYPITVPDFISADVTDSVMGGVISSFPTKYSSKVGKTDDASYRVCAMAYLGMYCASIFPICWLPIGLQEVTTFPLCFPQCLATLVACPGFWLDDIMGPCSDVSVPPFCSFSLFINQQRIPPQFSSFEDSHPFPQTCPKYDPLYDTPDDLFEPKEPLPSPEVPGKEPQLPAFPKKLVEKFQPPVRVLPKPCTCDDPSLLKRCIIKSGIPIFVTGDGNQPSTHYQTPSSPPDRCCRECNVHGAVIPGSPHGRNPKVNQRITKFIKRPKGPKLGHVVPVNSANSTSPAA